MKEMLEDIIVRDTEDTLIIDYGLTVKATAYFMELHEAEIVRHAKFCLDDDVALKVQAFREAFNED